MKLWKVILLIVVGSILALVIEAFVCLNRGPMQEALVAQVTHTLNHQLGTKASIGHIYYHFPAKLVIEDVVVPDAQGDSMLSLGRLYAHLSIRDLRHSVICFRRIEVDRLHADLHPMANGEWNYADLVARFGQSDTTASFQQALQLRAITLSDIVVRYDSLTLSVPHAHLALPYLKQDTLEACISECCAQLSKVGRSHPLDVTSLQVHILYRDSVLSIPQLRMALPHSEVDASGCRLLFPLKDAQQSLADYAAQYASVIDLHLGLNKAAIQLSDLAFVVPDLASSRGRVDVRAQVDGSLDSIRATNLSLAFDNEQIFVGNCSAIGLPDMHHAFLHAECQDLSLRPAKVERIIADFLHRPFTLPSICHRLGKVHYKGHARGRLNAFTLRGAFTTNMGTITTDGQCVSDASFESCVIDGRISSKRFRLGSLLDQSSLGTTSFTLTTSCHLSTSRQPYGEMDWHIHDLTFKDYPYQDITLRGSFDNLACAMQLTILDDNLDLQVNGQMDLNPGTVHEVNVDASLRKLCPGALHWSERFSDSEMRTQVHVRESFPDLDHISGTVVIDSTYLRNNDNEAYLSRLTIGSSTQSSFHSFTLDGQLMKGHMEGDFLLTAVTTSLLKQAAIYVPSAFTQQQLDQLAHTPTDTRFEGYLELLDLQPLQRVLDLPVAVSDHVTLHSYFNEQEQQWGVELRLPYLLTGKAMMNDFVLQADNHDQRANMTIQMELDNTLVDWDSHAVGDSITLALAANALPPYVSHGALNVVTLVNHYAGYPIVDAHILPTIIQLGDSVYRIADSHISYSVADTVLTVTNFQFQGTNHAIKVDGIASSHPHDSLSIQLQDLNLGALMPYLLPTQTLTAQGHLSGWANLFSLFGTPKYEAEVVLDSAKLNNDDFGRVQADVTLDRATGDIVIRGDAVRHGHTIALVEGRAETRHQRFQLDIQPDSVPIGFLSHWTSSFLQDIRGTASGKVCILGDHRKTWILTRVKAHNVGVTVPFTGARYYINDSIFMDSTSISFPHLTAHDAEGTPFAFDAYMTHNEYFRNFNVQLHAAMNNVIALDLPHAFGQTMQGKVYATGTVDITGPDNDLVLDVNAAATGKSVFQLSLGGTSSAKDNSFIHFVSHNGGAATMKDTLRFLPSLKNPRFLKGESRFRANMDLEIDPQTLFQLVLDERTGDMIAARGDGSLKLTYDDATDDLRLVGNYTIAEGKMNFTVANLIRRDFVIASGSQIIWNGKAEQPILDVTARYTISASLKDLFGSETENIISGRTTVPVSTVIHLTGTLEDPIIRFAIELPKSEENIENQVKAVINTEEMMLRQVVYLLVFGRFQTPDYIKPSSSTALLDTYSLLSNTITNQINNWLGRLTDMFTLGFAIRSEGLDAKDVKEYEAMFQLQPVDRLIINGNFGYRYNDVSNTPFFGDLDIECLLTENGKFRLKGYTHTVDKYSLKQASTIQGIGFLFRHDFNWRLTEEEKRLAAAKKAARQSAREKKKAEKANHSNK